jgi:hypothetical protein
MTRLGRTKRVDPALAAKYRRVGAALLESATLLADLADSDRFANAIAIVAIHAAIAWCDALTIAYSGHKSTDGDHTRAAYVVRDAMGNRANERALYSLHVALNAKDKAAYSGTYYHLHQSSELLRAVQEFVTWAEAAYDARPSV